MRDVPGVKELKIPTQILLSLYRQNIFINKGYISRLEVKSNYIKLSNFKYGYKLDLCSLRKLNNFFEY